MQRILNFKNKAVYIGAIGGGIALIFSYPIGLAFSSPMLSGASTAFYLFFVIAGAFIAIVGGVVSLYSRRRGAILLFFSGCMTMIGYGVSPASIFGILFVYGSLLGLKRTN